MFIIYFQLVPHPAGEPGEVPELFTDHLLYPLVRPVEFGKVRANSPTAHRPCRASEPSYLQNDELNQLRTRMMADYSLRSGRFYPSDLTEQYPAGVRAILSTAPFYLQHSDIYEIGLLLGWLRPTSLGCYWTIGLGSTLVDVFSRTDPHIEFQFENEEDVLRCAELSVKGGERYYFALPEKPSHTTLRYVALFTY
jgi:hypothetical protein